MRGIYLILIILMLLVLVSVTVHAQTGNGYALTWWTIDGGGSQNIGAGGYNVSDTLGQTEAGRASGEGYQLIGGYWSGAPTLVYDDYLPVIIR